MPLQIVRQDIINMQVDAIVNTSNEKMVGYSGVDLAIHKAAGPLLDEECAKLVPLELGQAKITGAYNLDCKYIIHTSGPVWHGGDSGESDILKSCYLESLKLAVENNCESVAFPLISSGRYGFPKDRVLKFAVQVITEFLFDYELTVYICVFDRTSYEISKKLFSDINEIVNDQYVTESSEMEYNVAIPCPSSLNIPNLKKPSFIGASAKAKRETGKAESLEEYLKKKDKSFANKLFDLIDERGMTDVECYKKANVDRKTFSKIKSKPETYKPSKQTAIAFAIALKLNLEETQDLLASAGLTLSNSVAFDRIIRYFIKNRVYDIFEINEALFEFDQVLLGV